MLQINSINHYIPKDISNYLGDYFANVGKEHAQKIAPSSTHINEYLSKKDQNINSFYVLPIDRGDQIKWVLVMIISAMFCSKNYIYAFHEHLHISLICQFNQESLLIKWSWEK